MVRIRVVDSHTGGEPTRVVIHDPLTGLLGHFPHPAEPPAAPLTVADRLTRYLTQYDALRRAVSCEPRGSDVMVGAVLCEPADPSCVSGVIYFNNTGFLQMCGHATIGVAVTLAHLGRIGPGTHRMETRVGVVTFTLAEDGSVALENVPSYRKAAGVEVTVPGHGIVRGDVAWGGNWFFLAHEHGQALALERVDALVDFAWRVRQAINAPELHPEVDHIELLGPSPTPGKSARGFVLCPGRAYDRSACGTGTSAKLACLAADGRLAEGATWVQESIIGSSFEGRYRWVNIEKGEIIPTIISNAHVMAEADLLLDPRDPFCWGISGSPSAT